MDKFIEAINYRKKIYNENLLIERNIRTAFIGAISCFEKYFSYLWQDNEDFKDLWENCRKEILDIGNNQIRNFRGRHEQN